MSKDLRYPIGEFDPNFELSPDAHSERIKTLVELPQRLKEAVAGLNNADLSED